MHIALARVLGPDSYGAFYLTVAWISILALAGKAGLDTATTRFTAAYAAADDWPRLGDKPWIATSVDCAFHQQMQLLTKAQRIDPATEFMIDAQSTTVGLVARGLGVSIVTRSMAEPAVAAGRVAYWSDWSAPMPRSVVCLRARQDEAMIAAFRDACAQVLAHRAKVEPPRQV